MLRAMSERASVASSANADARLAGKEAMSEAGSSLRNIKTVIAFGSASHGQAIAAIAEGIRERAPEATVAVVGSPGILAPAGETEGVAAVTLLALDIPSTLAVREDSELGMLGESLRHRPARSAFLFARTTLPALEEFREGIGHSMFVGARMDTAMQMGGANPGQDFELGQSLALRIDGGMRLALEPTIGQVPISDELVIEGVEGPYVTQLGGLPALEQLTRAMQDKERQQVFVLHRSEGEERVTVRYIGGLDPDCSGLHLGAVEVGDVISFAIVDAQQGRRDLQRAIYDVTHRLAGGVAIAAVYLDSLARGRRLYEDAHVDPRILRAHLKLPFVGVRSSAEYATIEDRAQTFGGAGVIAVIYAPS